MYRGNKRVFRLRDSITLLPNNLDVLALLYCPQCGYKGSIDHNQVKVENLNKRFQHFGLYETGYSSLRWCYAEGSID